MGKKKTLFFLIYLLQVIVVYGQSAYDKKLQSLYKHTVPLIQPVELKQEVEEGKPVIILDTRSGKEFAVSHIKGARFVNYDGFNENQLKDLDKKATVVVYCSVGYRSERIGEKLKDNGFTNVRNLYGGIFQWANEGNPVFNKSGRTDSVHTYSKKWSVWLQRGIKVY